MNFFTWVAHLLRFTKRKEEPADDSVQPFDEVIEDMGIIPANFRKDRRKQ